jgi:hypothetical protein
VALLRKLSALLCTPIICTAFDRGPTLELEAEFSKEINCPFEVIDDDSYIVHPF